MQERMMCSSFFEEWITTIVALGEGLADYVIQRGIKNVILLDRAARPAYIPLKHALQNRGPDMYFPEIYFFNPRFCPRKTLLKKREQRFEEAIKLELPRLYNRRELPTMMFDVCIHTGSTAWKANRNLKEAGFRDLSFVVASTPRAWDHPAILPDRAIFSASRGCYLLSPLAVGSDELILKEKSNVVSKAVPYHLVQAKDGRALREFMHEKLRTHYRSSG